MKKSNIAILFIGAAIFSAILYFSPAGTRSLSGSSFVETYQKTTGAVLLDVRTPAEFAVGHIAQAINVDFENPTFSTEVMKLDKEKEYFVYCRSGNRSGQAITIMKQNGFTHISELAGGVSSNTEIKLIP